jgi:EmrB/QacA subfamily drug resistance transporter
MRVAGVAPDAASTEPRATPAQRWVLVATSLAMGLAFLDETAVVTALPAIQREFQATSSEVQWVVAAYLLALASLMSAAGRLADIFGRKRLFVIGAVVFGLGSAACAAAPDELLLAVARAIQGIGGSLLIPLAMANATAIVPAERRGWAIGVISTVATVFLALGPLIGGSLVELASWRWIFLVNLPVIAAIVILAVRWMPETTGAGSTHFDGYGLVLLVSGLVCVALGLLQAQDWGAGSPATLAVLAAGVAFLAGFVMVERRSREPLIDLRLLRIPAVVGSLVALFAFQFAIMGLTVYLTLYLQLALGYSPAAAGALTLPTVVMAPFLSGYVGRLSDQIGTRLLTPGATLLASIAVGAIGLLSHIGNVWLLMPAFLLFGIARPIGTIAGSVGTVAAIPAEHRGLASSLASQSRQLGAVLGVALLGLVLSTVESRRRDELLAGVDSGFGHRARAVLDGILSGSHTSNEVLSSLAPSAQAAARGAAATAYIAGFSAAMYVTAGLALVAAVVSFALLNRRPAPEAT